MSDKTIIYCKVEEGGTLPTKAHSTDAGYDVYATSDFEVKPGQVVKHPLNIRLQLPEASYMEITSKSGNGAKGLLVYAGIIDESYTGIIHAVVTNVNYLTGETLYFKKGQKISQMIIHPYRYSSIERVNEITSSGGRGEGGFGSSGSF